MPVVIVLLLMVGAAAMGYAVVVNAAHNAIARGAAPETTALRFLPLPVQRHAYAHLLPGVIIDLAEHDEVDVAEAPALVGAAPVAPEAPVPPLAPPPLAPAAPDQFDGTQGFAPGPLPPGMAPERWPEPAVRHPPWRGALRRGGRPGRAAVRPPRSRVEMRMGHLALRRLSRRDRPVWRRATSLVLLVAVIMLLALTLTATVFAGVSYVVSLFSRAIRS